jgi:hypothetical protein
MLNWSLKYFNSDIIAFSSVISFLFLWGREVFWFFFFYCFYIYLNAHTLFVLPTFWTDLFRPPILWFCWRENIRDNRRDIVLLLVWDKDNYTEKFLALLPFTCVLQPRLVHLYQISSLLPGPLSIVASERLRLLYSFLYSEHINHIQVLGFLSFPVSPVFILPLVCGPCPIVLLHLF